MQFPSGLRIRQEYIQNTESKNLYSLGLTETELTIMKILQSDLGPLHICNLVFTMEVGLAFTLFLAFGTPFLLLSRVVQP